MTRRDVAGTAGRMIAAMALACGALAGGAAAQDACKKQGDTYVCQAEGFGTVINNDKDQARDEARTDARRRALEQVVGVQLDAETITRNQVLVDQFVRSQTSGVVTSDRILEDGLIEAGRYRVKIEAWVKETDLRAQMAQNISDVSMIVDLPERNIGQERSQRWVQDAIIAKLAEIEARVMDPAQVAQVAVRNQLAAVAQGNSQAARDIGLKFLANLFIVGEATTRFSQNNSGIVSAYAQVTAKLIEAETGRIVKVVSLPQERGFARDDVGAGERALMSAAPKVATEMLDAVKQYLKIKERDVDIRFRGLPSLDEYRRAKVFLEKVRFVSGATERGFDPGESVIVVKLQEKTIFLASRLRQEPRYTIRQVDRNNIVVEFKR